MTKTTKAERATRINEIYKLLIVGTPRPAILQYASENWGEISDRSVDSYIADVRKLMVKELQDNRQIALAEEIELRRHIINQALTDKKYQTALQAADSRAKLLGLFESLDRAVSVVLACGYVVIDPRVPAQNTDLDHSNPFADILGSDAIPFDDVLARANEIEPTIIPTANRNLEELLAKSDR